MLFLFKYLAYGRGDSLWFYLIKEDVINDAKKVKIAINLLEKKTRACINF